MEATDRLLNTKCRGERRLGILRLGDFNRVFKDPQPRAASLSPTTTTSIAPAMRCCVPFALLLARRAY